MLFTSRTPYFLFAPFNSPGSLCLKLFGILFPPPFVILCLLLCGNRFVSIRVSLLPVRRQFFALFVRDDRTIFVEYSTLMAFHNFPLSGQSRIIVAGTNCLDYDVIPSNLIDVIVHRNVFRSHLRIWFMFLESPQQCLWCGSNIDDLIQMLERIYCYHCYMYTRDERKRNLGFTKTL